MRSHLWRTFKARPLKLTMKNINEKNANEDLLWVRITHDLTIEKGKQIAMKVKQARERTLNDSRGYVWMVRQTPHGKIKVIWL